MSIGFFDLIRALAKTLKLQKHFRETGEIMNDRQPGKPDRTEVENAIATFRELISKLSQNGTEIGELYLSAERKAARYALLSETVVESVTSGILVVNDMHEICLANSAAKRALGCDDRLELTGRRLGDLFEEHGQLESLVSEGLRTSQNSYRKVVNVTLHAGTALCLGVSTSCVTSGKSKPEAVIIVFTQLDRDATGTVGGQAGDAGASAEAYRKGMLDAYGIVSEIFTDIESLRAEIDAGQPDIARLKGVAERVAFGCDLMVGFALSKVAPGAMTELVDLNAALRNLLGARGLSGRRVTARFGSGLPRVSTVRRVLDAGLDMLFKGCLAESADGIEVMTRREGPEDSLTVTLSIVESSPTMPLVEVKEQPGGFLEGKGLRREMGLMLLKSLPVRAHALAVSRSNETFTYSLSFLLPKLRKEEKGSTSRGFTENDSTDGGTGH